MQGFFAARLRGGLRIQRGRHLLCAFAHEDCICTRRAKMERSLSKRNHREIQACSARKAVDCLAFKREEVSCHKSWYEMTPDIRHLKSVSGGASNNAFRYTTALIVPFSVHFGMQHHHPPANDW